jgi:hypothetical protein
LERHGILLIKNIWEEMSPIDPIDPFRPRVRIGD